jgi:hypothetical protein
MGNGGMARCDAHDEISIPEMANDALAEKSGSAKYGYEHEIILWRPTLLAAAGASPSCFLCRGDADGGAFRPHRLACRR